MRVGVLILKYNNHVFLVKALFSRRDSNDKWCWPLAVSVVCPLRGCYSQQFSVGLDRFVVRDVFLTVFQVDLLSRLDFSASLGLLREHTSQYSGELCKRAYAAIYTLRRIILGRSSIGLHRRLYLCDIQSVLTYGSQVWNPPLLQDIKKLEQVQLRETKFMLQEPKLRCKERLINLVLLPLIMWLDFKLSYS